MKNLLAFYLATARISIINQFQYRVAQYFYLIGMVVEPTIYLVVWSTVARAQGGALGGYTPGAFAAYYIVWTLVRSMNIVFTPFGWEWRIRQGQLSGMLVRPVHPLHYDLAYYGGMKIAWILFWLPLAGILILTFRPELNPTALEIAVFAVAIWGAYLIRSMLLWLLGLITFWTTRVGAIFELYFALELLFSGRLVPMSLMPDWAQQAAAWMPFKWAFQFPIEALVGRMSPAEMLGGLGMQVFWTLASLLALQVVWRRAVREYAAVGG